MGFSVDFKTYTLNIYLIAAFHCPTALRLKAKINQKYAVSINKIAVAAKRDVHRWKEIAVNIDLIFNFRDKNLLTF